jgi:hypothetical protein
MRVRDLVRKTCEAARAVAAHFGLAPVTVKVPHPEIRLVGRLFEQENPIRADAAVAIANLHDLVAI